MAGDNAWLASLQLNRGGLVAQVLVECQLPRVVDPELLASAELRTALARALVDVGEECEIDFANVCFALDHNLVLLKRSELVPGGDKAMREHMQWEAEQFLDGGDEELSVDYLLASSWGFAVAARYSALDSYLDLGEEAGMGELLVYAAQNEAYMLLLDEGEPLQVASCRWNKEDDSVQIMADVAARLVQEVDGEVGCIWCAGPEEEQWSPALSSQLGISVSLLDPLATVDTGMLPDEMTPSQRSAYAIAVGLALRGIDS
jgi:Tfp pilus assembly PilM family ATPase